MMQFSKKLNNYIDIIGCTAKELSVISNISTPVLSRYRKGERIPKYQSKQLENLIKGLTILAKKYHIEELNEKIIRDNLEEKTNKNNIDFNNFRNNMNILIETLNINVSEMSKFIGFDSSYLSKIRSGVRKPQHIDDFAKAIVLYIINNYDDTLSKEKISYLTKHKIEDINSKEKYKEAIELWIAKKIIEEDNNINNFLLTLDQFDLNEYIKAIKFDKIKVPTLPIQIPKSKTYYGLKGFKNSQLDILKTIVLSNSKEDIFFYSNMSMIESSKDLDFTKKFMIGLALILKKGLHLNIIHDLDRPLKELMLGLEGWIPLYMTGLITPYYFKNNSNLLYSQIECVSGTVALSGTSITGHINNSKYYVTTKKEEVSYYKENTKLLLKKANNLMEIYNEKRKEEYLTILNNNTNISGNRRIINATLPIYTISNSLLNKILENNKISNEKKEYIITQIEKEKLRINKILENNKITDEITLLTEKEFYQNTPYLSLSLIFYHQKINYTYNDYLEHIELIKKYQLKHKNYNYKINNKNIFKNINISIIENKQVIISKENNPPIHFVIWNPTLIDAIQKFKVPMIEKNDTH